MSALTILLILFAWLLANRKIWAIPGLVASTAMWLASVAGGILWNFSRAFNGSGIPQALTADVSLESPASRALLWAAVGCLASVPTCALVAKVARAPSKPVLRSRAFSDGPLLATSATLLLAWAAGQGPSLFVRNEYLHTDGVGILLTATSTVAPVLAATVGAYLLTRRTSLPVRVANIVLVLVWWISTLSVGTRLALAFPLGIIAAVIVLSARQWRRPLAWLAAIPAVYLLVFASMVTFSMTFRVRGTPHGVARFVDQIAQTGDLALLDPASWIPTSMQLMSSVASGFVITQQSVLFPAPAEVLWATANPLPQSLTGVDIFTLERLWPYSWVPLSMAGQWYGVYGPLGQVALFWFATSIGGVSAVYFSRKNQGLLAALAVVLAIASVLISIQYPSRWFWRLQSISVLLPIAYQAVLFSSRLVRPLRRSPRRQSTSRDFEHPSIASRVP